MVILFLYTSGLFLEHLQEKSMSISKVVLG